MVQSYVVYLGAHSHGPNEISLESEESAKDSHYELLASFLGRYVRTIIKFNHSIQKYRIWFVPHFFKPESMSAAKRKLKTLLSTPTRNTSTALPPLLKKKKPNRFPVRTMLLLNWFFFCQHYIWINYELLLLVVF